MTHASAVKLAGRSDGESAIATKSSTPSKRKADPAGIFHTYEGADHGFACDDRDSHHPGAAALAEERSLAFLAAHL